MGPYDIWIGFFRTTPSLTRHSMAPPSKPCALRPRKWGPIRPALIWLASPCLTLPQPSPQAKRAKIFKVKLPAKNIISLKLICASPIGMCQARPLALTAARRILIYGARCMEKTRPSVPIAWRAGGFGCGQGVDMKKGSVHGAGYR